MLILNKNIKLIINYLLGPLLFLLLLIAIYKQLVQTANWQQSLQQVKAALSGPGQWKIGLVLLLMLANWGIEARKWQLSISGVQQITWWRAFKATLTGSAMASLTPNRMGEYLGRILYIEEGRRLQTISLTILCSFSQIIVTLVTGCAGIIYILGHLHHNTLVSVETISVWLNVLLAIVLLVLVLFVLFYFRLNWLVVLVKKLPIPGKYLVYVKILEDVRARLLLRILLLSFIRYGVFILQYYLIFSVKVNTIFRKFKIFRMKMCCDTAVFMRTVLFHIRERSIDSRGMSAFSSEGRAKSS